MEMKLNAPEELASHEKTAPKRRVLFIITQSEMGGAQQFLTQLLNRIDKEKFELAVVVGQDGQHELADYLPQGISYITSKRLKRNPNVFEDILSIFELKKNILAHKPDILFLNSSKAGFNGSWAAKMASRRLSAMKVVYRIGGWTFNDPWPLWKKLGFRWLEKFGAGWKDYIILNNKYDFELAKKFGIIPRKELVLIHNGIDPYLEFLSREEARLQLFQKIARSGLAEGQGGQAAFLQADIIVGTIANFYPSKDIANLINAAAKTAGNIVFVIIGDGYLRPMIESQISALGLNKKVFLAGKIPNASRYLTALDIFVLPSNKEGFPFAVLEAMAAKVPIIATRVGAIPEIIEDRKNGIIVPSKNPEAIAGAIEELSQDDRLRQELAIQAHQNLIKNFSANQMVEKYEELFGRMQEV